MKVSIITVVRNAQTTIEDALISVQNQNYPNIEHIVIDGASTDDTLVIINQYKDRLAHIVSEPDGGIYDAMNKGIKLATGDVIGILNADDVYQDDTVISQVAKEHEDDSLDACYADLLYVKPNDMTQVVRYWTSQAHKTGLCFTGWMPAHPTLFLKSSVYGKVGLFDTTLAYQSDLEFCARLFELAKIKSIYIPKVWVRMRMGGVTNNSLATMFKGNLESYYALKKLGLKRNPIHYFLLKFTSRIPQFFRSYND